MARGPAELVPAACYTTTAGLGRGLGVLSRLHATRWKQAQAARQAAGRRRTAAHVGSEKNVLLQGRRMPHVAASGPGAGKGGRSAAAPGAAEGASPGPTSGSGDQEAPGPGASPGLRPGLRSLGLKPGLSPGLGLGPGLGSGLAPGAGEAPGEVGPVVEPPGTFTVTSIGEPPLPVLTGTGT